MNYCSLYLLYVLQLLLCKRFAALLRVRTTGVMVNRDLLYTDAARIVLDVRNKRGRVKSLVYASKCRNKAGLLALTSECLKHWDSLNDAFVSVGVPGRKAVHSVILMEFCRGISPECSADLMRPLVEFKDQLVSFARERIAKSPDSHSVEYPRYVRVNTLTAQPDIVMSELQTRYASASWDCILPNVIVLPARTNLSRDKLYILGQIVLQDRASCLPAIALDVPKGAVVLDACAAPGNKTTQLAALVGASGRVYAFERDQKRFKILQSMIDKHDCSSIVRATHADFLATNPADFADVKYILVDPSCSGSGIPGSSEAVSNERLKSLHHFQCTILRHAMRFPNVRRISYSTCSIHREENEDVVADVLATESRFALAQQPLPQWSRRGITSHDFAPCVIRCDPELDNTHGFFVAIFERK